VKRLSLFGFDFILLAAAVVLVIIGILFIYSSGITSTGVLYSNEHIRQIVWAATGLLLLVLFTIISYTRLKGLSPHSYAAGLVLLLITLLAGRVVHGSRSWLGIGYLGIQPSEFTKITTILFLAAYLSSIGKGVRELPRFLLGLAIVVLPMWLILLQPDMGTALVYLPIFLAMSFMAGARLRHLFFILASGMVLIVLGVLPAYERLIIGQEIPFLQVFTDIHLLQYFLAAVVLIAALSIWGTLRFKRSHFYWIMYVSGVFLAGVLGALAARMVLKDYQIMRLIVFLNPKVDPQGAGWNLIQSVTAVGSGGFRGKGFLQGTQSHFRFLPQQSTDFIFSILAEELGFFGGLIVFLLFLTILLRGVRIAYTARDQYALFVASGIVGMIFFHVVVNVGMAMGIMPITGIPLFFLSYGGSSLWTGLISIGILLNIHMRRYRFG
jgi:rod shape determining protein RodA